jgi:hypothetical protein
MRKNALPLIVAILLLLLPVLYLGSYLALVQPQGRPALRSVFVDPVTGNRIEDWVRSHYLTGYPVVERVYWPLEVIDRTVRPAKWDDSP